MRGRQRKKESKRGGGAVSEEEVAYGLQGERIKEGREREREKRVCERETVCQLGIRLYRLDGELREGRSEAEGTVCTSVCV